MDAPDHRLPLYQRLRDEIAEQIARNTWRPGEPISTEAELAATHKVAIGTIRKAIDALVADGMVERHQGRGTFVRRPSFDGSLFRFFRHHGQAGGRVIPESRILARDALTAPPDVATALKLRTGAEVIRFARLRLIEGKPVLSETIWLPRSRFAPLLETAPEDFGDLLYPTYERLCGEIVARAEETMTIATANVEDATLLGVRRGDPIAVIDRLAFGYDGKPIEWRRTHGSADSFRYHIEIR